MADNVMALVKKKGSQKKLRGKAAQRQKAWAAAAATARPKSMADKRNPFRPFRYMEPSEMIEELDSFVARAGWTENRKFPDIDLDREMIRMFNILRTGIPFPLVKEFFVAFDESDSFNVVRYFDEFRQRRYVRDRIENMKEIIRRRQATPLKIPKDLLRQEGLIDAERQYEKAKLVGSLDLLRKRTVSPSERSRPIFGQGEILSQCEREYRRAPWMFLFSDQVIRGFALKDQDTEFATSQEVQDGWYKANMAWYRMACEDKRRFVPDKVAYVTANNDLIVETEEMYRASRQDWMREFTPLDAAGFDVVKSMIMDNEVLRSALRGQALEDYAEAIIASFGAIETNYDLARKTSYVLVFLSSLIDEPQIYHEKIRAQEYPAEVLINLDRYTMLPEVFKDPDVDKTPTENKIKRARRSIENRYYELINQRDPGVRRGMRPGVAPVVPANVPLIIDDSVSRDDARPAVRASAVVSASVSREARVAKELAPGLFQRLRARITQMTPIYCNQCDTEVFAPPFTTVRKAERLKFCSKECFDIYDM